MVRYKCSLCKADVKAELELKRKPVMAEGRVMVWLCCPTCNRVAQFSISVSDYQELLKEVLQ
jgi:hypothetical protein